MATPDSNQKPLFDTGEPTKWCGKCKTRKPLSDFWTRKAPSGHRVRVSKCKFCSTADSNAWKKNHPEIVSRDHRRRMLASYGLDEQAYQRMLEDQKGRCAICGGPPSKTAHGTKPRRFHVDHHHQTGTTRGLLCVCCNTMIGSAKENIALLQAAAAYLLKYASSASPESS